MMDFATDPVSLAITILSAAFLTGGAYAVLRTQLRNTTQNLRDHEQECGQRWRETYEELKEIRKDIARNSTSNAELMLVLKQLAEKER